MFTVPLIYLKVSKDMHKNISIFTDFTKDHFSCSVISSQNASFSSITNGQMFVLIKILLDSKQLVTHFIQFILAVLIYQVIQTMHQTNLDIGVFV